MMFIGLLVIEVIAYLIYRLNKKTGSKDRNEFSESVNILNLRFAKGEIGEEEYNARKAAILK